MMEDRLDRLSDSIDCLNQSVTKLNAIVPTLATKEDVVNINKELVEVRAITNDNRLSVNKVYVIITILISTVSFFIGNYLPTIIV